MQIPSFHNPNFSSLLPHLYPSHLGYFGDGSIFQAMTGEISMGYGMYGNYRAGIQPGMRGGLREDLVGGFGFAYGIQGLEDTVWDEMLWGTLFRLHDTLWKRLRNVVLH